VFSLTDEVAGAGLPAWTARGKRQILFLGELTAERVLSHLTLPPNTYHVNSRRSYSMVTRLHSW
jgi:hypothetical protein